MKERAMAVVLVTGANKGIGLELSRQLKARSDEVIAACRKSSKALDALGVRVETGVEVSDDASIAALKTKLGDTKLDLLINNAGILEREGLSEMSFESIERQLQVNALGPLRVTTALLPLLREGGKVAIITSRMGSIADNGSGGYYGYRMSKAAVNAAGVSLAHDLKGRGVAVALLHPGMVNTDMTHHGIPPAESVRGLLARIDALNLQNTGRFWHATTGEILPW
jgi:NAD(P)-dependent dehydrogenase (short-subunit alcohol dehydrogenase family)